MGHRARESVHRGMSQSPRIHEQARIWPLVLHDASPLAYRLHSLCTAARHHFSLPDVAQHGGFRAPVGSSHLRSFAWAVSLVPVTSQANLVR